MTDLKQRLSDKRDELSRQEHDNLHARIGPFFTAEHYEMAVSTGFDILAQQIIELHEALDKIKKSHPDGNPALIIEKAREALEKFNKFLGEG